MKKNLLVAVAVMLATGTLLSLQAGDKYIIRGNIVGIDPDTKVYLCKGTKRIDSAFVKNGAFVISGALPEPAFTYLYATCNGRLVKLTDILLDNREITVTGPQPDYDKVAVTGSAIDQQWKEWYSNDQKLGYQRHRINMVYQNLIQNKDTSNARPLKIIMDELTVDRVKLIKTYVQKFNNSAAGAVLPTLCTIQDKLSRADYLEMFNSLTPEMRATSMGKEIIALSKKTKW